MGINTSIIQVVLKSLKLFDGTVFKYKGGFIFLKIIDKSTIIYTYEYTSPK